MSHHVPIAHGLAVAGKIVLLGLLVKVALVLLLVPLWRRLLRGDTRAA